MDTAKENASGYCPACGRSDQVNRGLEDFLARLGISDDMVSKLKMSIQYVAVEEYLNTARDYLKDGSKKPTSYAKDNPWKVAAGVAVLAVGVGLLITALNRD